MTVYSFGAPCIAGKPFTKCCYDSIYSFACSDDIITRLSIESVRELLLRMDFLRDCPFPVLEKVKVRWLYRTLLRQTVCCVCTISMIDECVSLERLGNNIIVCRRFICPVQVIELRCDTPALNCFHLVMDVHICDD